MTRKQAEKVAAKLTTLARQNAQDGDANWTESKVALADLKMTPTDFKDAAPAVWGCLPMGWGISVTRDWTAVTVTRPR